MGNAWKTTSEDISNIIHGMGKKTNTVAINHILNNLDHFKIEDAVLCGNNIEEQTNLAYIEIRRQIIESRL
jgi:hypothetical protein